MFTFWYVSLIGTLIIIIIKLIIIITKILGYQKWSKLCIDVPRTFIAKEFMLWYHLTLILYVSFTMSNTCTCKEIVLSDTSLTRLGKLRRKSQRIKTTSPPSLDKYFVEPKRDLLDNLEWFTTQHRKENYKKRRSNVDPIKYMCIATQRHPRDVAR